jgi:uncharacterized membrane protein
VNGGILWANLHLLFWLSLTPAVTHWMGENHFAAMPVALYGAVLFMTGFAYYILARILVAYHGKDSTLAIAFGRDYKGRASLFLYAAGVGCAFVQQWIALALYVGVAILWFIPDRRIEHTVAE